MKLLNYTLFWLTSILFVVVSAWAIFFYYQLLNEVKNTIDEGLANYKISLIANLKNNPQLLTRETPGNQNYFLHLIPAEKVLQIRDTYNDTLVYSEIRKETEPRRVLTTAFAAEDSFYELKIVSQELDRKELIAKIGNIIQMLQRLTELNKALLLISKIENKQFVNNENIDFDKIVKQVLSDFSDYVEFRKIKIHYSVNGNWIYKMNRQLAEILVRNLVKNAVFHNYKGGEVFISLFAAGFTIENTSAEPPLQPDQLFNRFSKNKNKIESTGLGLAIVKAITDVSGCSVSYRYNPQNRHEINIGA
jgi:signal transduction histidine kinase